MQKDDPIMLIEDDYIDRKSIKRTFKELIINNPLQISGNGREALDQLGDPKTPLPSLILIDINMPVMNGIEFIRHAKQNDLLRSIPIIVLTTSIESSDCRVCYNLGIAGYIQKPSEYQKFLHVIRTIFTYWNLCESYPH